MNMPFLSQTLRPLTLLAAGSLALSACSSGTSPAYDASGTWKGTLNTAQGPAAFTAVVRDSSGRLTGTVNLDNADTVPTDFTGNRGADNTATLNVPSTIFGALSIDGTFSGKTFTGTYRVNGGAATALSMTRQ
ncbi:hypothetical protein [Deinococcus hopiensis]|nr:hypothetical protein [Deinococcus hopiensis]